MTKKKRRYSYYDDYWPRYEPSRPIPVEDGIKARSQYGAFTKSWWADRWIKALTRLMDTGRLQRGRSYARRGQVRSIDVTAGQVAASVQGSRPRPYKVSIRLKPLTDSQWATVLNALAEQAIFAAQLLNGEMPPDVEEVFDAVHVPLFPGSRDDLDTSCSCPDDANPCKHIAAVYYLLGERFDQDPFLLFDLRGRTKEQIAAALRELRSAKAPVPAAPGAEAPAPVPEEAAALAADGFWSLGRDFPGAAGELTIDISRPSVELALLKRLGLPEFPGLRPATFQARLAASYDAVTERAVQLAFAEADRTGT